MLAERTVDVWHVCGHGAVMSEIVAIDITHHQLPLDPPFPASWDPQPRTKFPATIVRVPDSDGREGIGSGDVDVRLRRLRPLLHRRRPAGDLDRHAAVLANIEFHAGRPWPLDLALWDLAGKTAGQPVWHMLGGSLATTAAVRVERCAPPGRADGRDGPARGRRRLPGAEGPLRSSVDRRRPRRRRRRARRSGRRAELMVDCNQGWRMPWDTRAPWDVDEATDVAAQLAAELGVYWIEEPLHRGDYAGYAELRRRVDVKIAGGEMTREPYEFRELLERDCLDVFQPDCVCSQGITGLAPLAARSSAAGKFFTPHTWGNGIGVLANLHLTAGTVGVDGSQWLEFPYDPPEWSLARRDYPLRAPIEAEGGWVTLSEHPGLGIDLDEEMLARTASASATFD